MTEIPDRPFNKITMDLVTDFTKSNKGNKHILTIIDLLTGWPEVILTPNKSTDTITKAFIRHYLQQVLGTYRRVPNLTTGESPFFLVYRRDGNQPLHQLLQPLTRFLGNPDSGLLCLDQHRLSLSIAKKYLDDHRFLTAEKMTGRAEQDSKLEIEYTSKTKPRENGTSNGEQDTESSGLSVKDVTCISKTKLQERSDPVMSRTLS